MALGVTGAAADVCLSGGATGADTLWGQCATDSGQDAVHFSFEGHFVSADVRGSIVTVSAEQLLEADARLAAANRSLRRRFPTGSRYVDNLLRRSWSVVKDAESLYAVSAIDPRGMVKGGTAWGVQMFIDLHGSDLPCYVYDQAECGWFGWRGGWAPVESLPPPSGLWAGIGTRRLAQSGVAAVLELFGQDLNSE